MTHPLINEIFALKDKIAANWTASELEGFRRKRGYGTTSDDVQRLTDQANHIQNLADKLLDEMRADDHKIAFELTGLGDNAFALQERNRRKAKRWPLIQLYRKIGARPTELYDLIRQGVERFEHAQKSENES